MQYYYGENNLLRVLDEAEFWKRQEKEHTLVIRNSTPGLEPEFVNYLAQFESAFNQMEGKAIQLIETTIRSKGDLSPLLKRDINTFIEASIAQSQQFIQLIDETLTESEAVRSNQFAQTVINHIRRESEYFIGIAQTILYG
jgi:hypothetical protein